MLHAILWTCPQVFDFLFTVLLFDNFELWSWIIAKLQLGIGTSLWCFDRQSLYIHVKISRHQSEAPIFNWLGVKNTIKSCEKDVKKTFGSVHGTAHSTIMNMHHCTMSHNTLLEHKYIIYKLSKKHHFWWPSHVRHILLYFTPKERCHRQEMIAKAIPILAVTFGAVLLLLTMYTR